MCLEEIIARLEKGETDEREMDAAIAEALGHRITWATPGTIQNANGGPVIHWQAPHPYAGMKEPCPHYCTSLDAALTLVDGGAPMLMARELQPDMGGKQWNVSLGRGAHRARAATPALALCIASLKARAAS